MQTIYNPKGQAGEFGEWAANPYKGCGNACAYCYVPNIRFLKMSRTQFDDGAILKEGWIDAFRKKAFAMQRAGQSVNIFFTFMSDMYHPFDTTPTREILRITKEAGHSFTILTKGGSRALRDIDLYTKRDHYAATLTSLDAAVSKKWERGAALPMDRIETLEKFHNAGIFTWASLEPVLNADSSIAVIERTHEFVDFYKLGRMNYVDVKVNWEEYTARLVELVDRLKIKAYFKKDLQPYLPDGYPNAPLRPS